MTPKTGRERIAEMDQITLRMGNVVKLAASEEASRALEAKGFVRDGAPGSRSGTDRDTGTAEAANLKKELADTKESCKKRVDDLQKKLDKELEWKPCDGGTNYEQDRYEKLAGSVGTKELQEHEAKNLIYEEFGFAPEKVKIISEVSTYEANKYHQMRIVERYKRKPLYNATDWNYIRFDCAGWQYEMVNGSLRDYAS